MVTECKARCSLVFLTCVCIEEWYIQEHVEAREHLKHPLKKGLAELELTRVV